MISFRNSSRLIVLILMITMVFASSCKSKKKAMEAAAAEKARMEQEANLRKQQEEEQRRKDAEEQARRDAEAKAKEASAPRARLGQYFDAISSATDATTANRNINEALTLFSSPDTPVLIVISESGGAKDYDRPTTIRNYLNYLKDQRKKADPISDLKFDASGKITEVELKKNQQ